MREFSPRNLKAQIRNSLEDRTLRAAVRHATAVTLEKRARLVDTIPHWEALRAEAARMKSKKFVEAAARGIATGIVSYRDEHARRLLAGR